MAGNGQIYSFSDTVTTVRSIGNVVSIIDPRDIKCLSYFGTKNQNRHRLQGFPNHKYEWLEDTLRVRTATFNNSGDPGTTDTSLTVATDHGLRFKKGDVWELVGGELIYISAVSGDNLTVIRNWRANQGGSEGTAATSVADSTALTYKFSARLEGADSDPSHWTTPTANSNYSMILHAELKVSGSEQNATTRYGIPDTYKYQIAKLLGGAGAGNGKMGRAGDLMIDLENTFFGKQVATQRTASVPGVMAGPRTMITTNVTDANGATLTPEMLEDSIVSCWDAGGMPDVIICNQFNKRLISSWYKDQVRTERTERTGGFVIDKLETEFGTYDLMLNRFCPSDEIYIMQRDKAGWITLRDWFVEPLAKDGDYKKDQIVGEFGFVLENESAHALLHDLATS